MGTRRTEELIADGRSLSYSEDYSLTEGWDDDVFARILNLGLNNLYHAITEDDQPAYVEQVSIDSVANQQAYDLPIDVYMAIRLVDVRFIWGNQDIEFNTLVRSQIQDRWNYTTNYPDTYCIRNGQILLSPTPGITKTDALVINYQKRPRELDVRRGQLASKTDAPVTITLTFPSTSAKYANMQTYANSQLDLVDYCCIVDIEGTPVVSAIPIANYNSTTQVITALTSYSFPADELTALDAAIAAGTPLFITRNRYSSSHSELDSQCEDYLIEYAVKRMLRLQSNMGEMREAMAQEQEALERLINAFKRYRPSVFPVRWTRRQGLNTFPFGKRFGF